MAINKNFVIKNGVQVSTDLIIGDTDTNKVGIGTTVPHYDLHVGVARGSRGGIGVTDAVVAGVATINQLSVTGISTFAGALDVNSTVDFAGDVVFNGTNDITYDQSESALVFNDGAAIRVGTGSDFSIMHDGNNTILRERGTGALKILSNSVELLGATAGETLAKFNENGNVELYHDNTKHFEVVAIGATVFGDLTISGVTTSKELNVSSGSTFGGLVDANAGAHIDNLRLGIDADNDITTSSGNLTLDSAGGTVEINDNLTVDGLLDANAGAHIDNLRLGIDADNDITTSSGNLTLDSTGGTVEVNDNLQVDGQTDLNGDINLGDATSETVTVTARFDSDLIPSSDNARDLGSSSLQWKDLHLNGTANIDVLDVDSTSNFADDVVFAGAAANITFDQSEDDLKFDDSAQAKFGADGDLSIFHNGTNSKIVDSHTNAFQIQSNDIRLQSTGGESYFRGLENGAAELYYDNSKKLETTSGGLDITGITTISDRLQVTSGISTFYDTTQSTSATTGAVIINGGVGIAKNVNIGGNLTVTGTTTFNGGTLTLGDANTDNIVFGGEVDSNIIPDDDNTHDLGSSSQQWKDIYIHGVGYIDSISADTAAISDLTSGRVVLAGTSGELEDSGNLTFNGSTLAITGSIDLSADIDVDGTANLDNIDVDGTSNFADDVTLVAAGSSTILFDASGFDLTFQDNIRAKFGTGKDLAIYHDGLNSYIDHTGTEDLYVKSSNDDLYLQAADDIFIRVQDTEDAIKCIGNAQVELYYDNSKKLETTSGGVNITGITTFSDRINVVSGISTFADNAKLTFGTQADLTVFHDGTDSTISNTTGDLIIQNTGGTGDDINIKAADDFTVKVQGSEAAIDAIGNGEVILYHNANARITTTDDGADIGGTGALAVPKGADGDRPSSPATGDFRYNTTDNQFEGYTDEGWGAIAGSGGGATEVDTSVSTTSATSTGSFAKASFRSASIIAQITQGSAYQVGRYLLIHDGTTVTTIEESAVATGSMLGTFEGVINGSNVEFRVTMGSSSSATVKTKIDTVTV